MSHGIQNLIERTRILAGLAKARGLSDRQLLERFADGDEAAFSAVVERYGGLVMGVCRRVLQHTQDAEDAFQATFMVLARKAGKIAWHDSVANWLHGVAYRVSCQVRRETARLRTHDLAGHEPAVNEPDPTLREIKPVLDEELARLPARYRIPLILCCLEGKSRDEAAAQLGWSLGSVKGRLERGRELLKSRLTKRGLTLSAVLGTTLLAGAGAQAAVPVTLGLATVRAGMAMLAGQTVGIASTHVLSLTQGVVHAMFVTKLKIAAAVLIAVGTLSLGTGYVTHRALAARSTADSGNRHGAENVAADSYETIFAAEVPEYVAQREERNANPGVTGVVQEVDAAKKTINVRVSRIDAAGQTYELAKDVKVLLREGRAVKAGTLENLKQGTRVVLTLDAGKKIVESIVVFVPGVRVPDAGGRERAPDGAVAYGLLTDIDAAKNKITLHTANRDRSEAKDTTYDLAKNVKVIFRAGRLAREKKLADLEPKTRVQIRLDAAKKLVTAIEVTIATTVAGAVSEINGDSITLETGGREGNAKSETYALGKDVTVHYRLPSARTERAPAASLPMKLADVALKMRVTLQLDDERKVVKSIDVALQTIRGSVQSVDAKKLTILVRPGRGDDVNFDIAKDARVIVDGKAGKLDAVATGAEVALTLAPDRQRVLILQTPPPEGR